MLEMMEEYIVFPQPQLELVRPNGPIRLPVEEALMIVMNLVDFPGWKGLALRAHINALPSALESVYASGDRQTLSIEPRLSPCLPLEQAVQSAFTKTFTSDHIALRLSNPWHPTQAGPNVLPGSLHGSADLSFGIPAESSSGVGRTKFDLRGHSGFRFEIVPLLPSPPRRYQSAEYRRAVAQVQGSNPSGSLGAMLLCLPAEAKLAVRIQSYTESPSGSTAESIFSDTLKAYSETEVSSFADPDWGEESGEVQDETVELKPESPSCKLELEACIADEQGAAGELQDEAIFRAGRATASDMTGSVEDEAMATPTRAGSCQDAPATGYCSEPSSGKTAGEKGAPSSAGGHWLGEEMDTDLAADDVGDGAEQQRDEYWVWSRDVQKFCHWDAESKRWTFCPDAFD